jgi:hypothetical protein
MQKRSYLATQQFQGCPRICSNIHSSTITSSSSSYMLPNGMAYIVSILKSQARFAGRIMTELGDSLENMPPALLVCFRNQIHRILSSSASPEFMRHIKAKYIPARSSNWRASLDLTSRGISSSVVPAVSLFNVSLLRSGSVMSKPLLVIVAGHRRDDLVICIARMLADWVASC